MTTNEISSVRPTVAGTGIINPVLSEIRRQLQASPFAAIRKLRCDFHEGVAILRGRVPTFYTQQVAQALVRKTAGVAQLDDRITVDGMVRSLRRDSCQ